MRGTGRRTWVKLYITGWLHGSIRWQLNPEERSVWADLICLAGECGKSGAICDNDGRALPMEYIANRLNIPVELLQTTIDQCKEEGRVKNDNGVIEITHWATYQPEYQRQKVYRRKAKLFPPYEEYNNVLLTKAEYDKLLAQFGEKETRDKVEALSLYKLSKGKEYKDDYATILSWDRRDRKEGKNLHTEGGRKSRYREVNAPDE